MHRTGERETDGETPSATVETAWAAPPPATKEAARVVATVVTAAERLRRVTPEAVPVAFWDFDGTLLEGDCVDGHWRGDGAGYAGLLERAIRGGLCPAFAGADGVARCEREYRARLASEGKAAAYAFQSQIFAGMPEAPLVAAARAAFEKELAGWLFAEALAWWRALEGAGVRCWVLSASPEFFVRAAAGVLGVPEVRCTGMRLQRDPDGRLRRELAGPATVGEGKVRRMRELLGEMQAAEPGRAFLPVAAFGNDPQSDGPMIEAVGRGELPAGEAVGVYVNLPEPLPAGVAGVPVRFRPREMPGASAPR